MRTLQEGAPPTPTYCTRGIGNSAWRRCEGDPPAINYQDDTGGTTSTGYLIAVVCLMASRACLADGSLGMLGTFFALKGPIYFIFQLLHGHYHEWEDAVGPWAYGVGVMGTGALAAHALDRVAERPGGERSWGRAVAVFGPFAALAANSIAAYSYSSRAACALAELLVLGYCVASAAWRSGLCAAALGPLVAASGICCQVSLAPRCGDAAYRACWRDGSASDERALVAE